MPKSSGTPGGGTFGRELRRTARIPALEERPPLRDDPVTAAAAARLYENRRAFSSATGRWRSGEAALAAAENRPAPLGAPRREAAAPPPADAAPAPARPKPRRFNPPAVEEKPVEPPKPKMSAQKARDYGFGIPSWSPYYAAAAIREPDTTNQSYGEFTRHPYLIDLHEKLAKHAAESAAQLKLFLDPSSAEHCAVKDFKEKAIANLVERNSSARRLSLGSSASDRRPSVAEAPAAAAPEAK